MITRVLNDSWDERARFVPVTMEKLISHCRNSLCWATGSVTKVYNMYES